MQYYFLDFKVWNGIFGKPQNSENDQEMSMTMHHEEETLNYSYTMGCPSVRGDTMQSTSFREWIILHTGGQIWYDCFIPITSV